MQMGLEPHPTDVMSWGSNLGPLGTWGEVYPPHHNSSSLPLESQPQNPEFSNSLEKFHP